MSISPSLANIAGRPPVPNSGRGRRPERVPEETQSGILRRLSTAAIAGKSTETAKHRTTTENSDQCDPILNTGILILFSCFYDYMHQTAKEIEEEDSEVTQTSTPENHQKDF